MKQDIWERGRLAGLKLIAGILVVLVIAIVTVFSILGNPFQGFDVFSVIGSDSGSAPLGNEKTASRVALEEILAENPDIDANLSEPLREIWRDKINAAVKENPDLNKEQVQGLMEGLMANVVNEWQYALGELEKRKEAEPKEVSEEFSITIGGKTYTQRDLAGMSEEELKALEESMTPGEKAAIEASQPSNGGQG